MLWGSSRDDARTAAKLLLAAAQAFEASPGSGGTLQEFAREIETVREIEALSQDIRAEGARLSAEDASSLDAAVESDEGAALRTRGAEP